MKRYTKNKEAFTLTELVVSIAASVIVIGGISAAAQKGMQASIISKIRSDQNIHLENILQRVAAHVQQSVPPQSNKPGAPVHHPCPEEGEPVCQGSYLIFKTPIVDTLEINDGRVAFGACISENECYQYCWYRYLVNDNQLYKQVICDESQPYCGDGTCNEDYGEDCDTCFPDCEDRCTCGDRICQDGIPETGGPNPEEDLGENCLSCPEDCGGVCCPNGFCDIHEDCLKCPADCGICENQVAAAQENFGWCGDRFCDASIGETVSSCAADCDTGETPVDR